MADYLQEILTAFRDQEILLERTVQNGDSGQVLGLSFLICDKDFS